MCNRAATTRVVTTSQSNTTKETRKIAEVVSRPLFVIRTINRKLPLKVITTMSIRVGAEAEVAIVKKPILNNLKKVLVSSIRVS